MSKSKYIDILIIENLNFPAIILDAKKLEAKGKLIISDNNLVYLDIDDNYIHQLFPLLKLENHSLIKPDYFGVGLVGAHISVIYPEENIYLDINCKEMDQEHCFEIKDIFAVEIGMKKYYGLLILAPSLSNIRKKYGLNEKPLFKGCLIDFHITIGVQL